MRIPGSIVIARIVVRNWTLAEGSKWRSRTLVLRHAWLQIGHVHHMLAVLFSHDFDVLATWCHVGGRVLLVAIHWLRRHGIGSISLETWILHLM